MRQRTSGSRLWNFEVRRAVNPDHDTVRDYTPIMRIKFYDPYTSTRDGEIFMRIGGVFPDDAPRMPLEFSLAGFKLGGPNPDSTTPEIWRLKFQMPSEYLRRKVLDFLAKVIQTLKPSRSRWENLR